MVLEYARPILHEERLMRQALEELAGGGSGIAVGSIAPASMRYLVSQLLGERTDLCLSTTSLAKREVCGALLDGRVDLAIGLADDVLSSFASKP